MCGKRPSSVPHRPMSIVFAYSETAPQSSLADAPIVDCTDPSAHMKNIDIEATPAAPKKGDATTTEMKGDLDEDITGGNVNFNVDLSLFKLAITTPFSISPSIGATSGIDATVGLVTLPNIPLIPNVKGGVQLTEQNGDPLLCINSNMLIAEEAVAV